MNQQHYQTEDVAGCPIRSVLSVIAAKWPMLVVFTLSDGQTKFFGELRRAIPDISPKMLSQALKTLVEEEIISRCVVPLNPPRTHYQLTDYGRTLLEAMTPLTQWALRHMAKGKVLV